MSLHAVLVPAIPTETVRVAQAVFRKGNRYLQMRDELGVFYQDRDFAALYASQGKPAIAPWRLALVTVMQFVEDLSDRQAAEAVRSRIDWKYALSLELDDPGFDHSVLSEFRQRLVDAQAEQALLEAMLKCFQARGLLKARGKQRTDSTHVLSSVRAMSRLEHLGETLRATLNDLATVAPEWVQQQVPVEWYDRYGTRCEEYRIPNRTQEREAWVTTVGADGFYLLDLLYAEATPEAWRQRAAVQLLRQMWLQQYYAPQGSIRLRTSQDCPPNALRLCSPYDPQARQSLKRTMTWIGYKVHLTESCDEQLPHLLTHVETTAATTPDHQAVPLIHQALQHQNLLPQQHFVDQGYTSTQLLMSSQHDYQLDLVGPVPANSQWQAQAGQGFSLSDFQIDWQQQRVYCPAGQQNSTWRVGQDGAGQPAVFVRFPKQQCLVCPLRTECTRSHKTGARALTFKPQQDFQMLQAARVRQHTQEFRDAYATRAGIEGTVSQALRVCGLRQCRYLGLAKAHLQHVLSALALNVLRAVAWLDGVPLARTRQSRFARLAPAPA
ncbi:IS1182 family transposase [Leptolyngbya boryana CZ1]|uniref:IS1182 family transposase n=1 Tax=Leptolyngbya boryana CZ1 TaxID=3060204 RepID=A0AA97AWG3_LEPBY|nr:IS1182 family transposase [Leptolyngbya boryana]WNZ45287.1 IS1182 family transposase [Leptolyngbya boryana CZ1]WNZ45324.1 IS1182 family transposase [Leptolyngbya boryana CZ1]WNZ47116.1 IS1182 family transposase [Leptolyngbya boryana CZ1]WNZ48148.1 IS1182 family transposase [Leptolyngbya boryana CZ1]WNZ48280.1 IS1182 family transposase [Leptolyngbya boryana CZ1]